MASLPLDDLLADLADRIRAARSVTVLTGAGISVSAGLPDFRGPDGLWRDHSLEELASIEMFREDPVVFWEFYRQRLAVLRGAEPTPSHVALARLERAGLIERVITQNVDGLHALAGSDPLEVHGCLHHAECLSCGERTHMDETEARAANAPDGVPRCTGCDEPLKPSVVLFGEMLPEAIEHAWALAEGSDLMLVCGTSLAVQPVGAFPFIVDGNGGTVAIINVGRTEAEHIADVRIDAQLDDVLPALAELLLDDDAAC